MGLDRGFERDNARQRARLAALADRLTEADLGRSLGGGWTVASALVHLAFWDLRAAALAARIERDGMGPSPIDVEVANETVLGLAGAIPPRAAARLAVRAAEAADGGIERLPDDVVAEVAAAGQPFHLTRHVHRAEHLDEIERALA
jgi:hypothetical protein